MEKVLNLFVGSFLLSNLYYLSPIVGLSNSSVIIFLIVVSFFGFILRFDLYNFKLLGTKLTFRIVTLSFILFIINSLWNYEIHINDIIRITCFTFYFCWTISIFKNKNSLLKIHLKKLLSLMFFLIVIMSFFEYYFYEIFKLIMDAEFSPGSDGRRLAITFRDPNSFAFATISFVYVYIRLEKSPSKIFIALITTILIVNLTGSRLGLLTFAVLFFPLLIKFFKNFNFSKVLLITLFLPTLFFIPISTNEDSKTDSLVERIMESEKVGGASESSNQRLESIRAGIRASNLSNIFIPPGNLLFRSKWESVVNARHYPHSTFLYMFVEYGIYVIWPLLILIPLYKKAKRVRTLGLYSILIIGLLLLPNLIYDSTAFFIIYYIGHEYSSYSSTINKNMQLKKHYVNSFTSPIQSRG